MNKTTILILAFFASFFIISSCKKDYGCKCTGSFAGFTGDTTIALGKLKKKDAKTQCSNYQNTYAGFASLVGATWACELD